MLYLGLYGGGGAGSWRSRCFVYNLFLSHYIFAYFFPVLCIFCHLCQCDINLLYVFRKKGILSEDTAAVGWVCQKSFKLLLLLSNCPCHVLTFWGSFRDVRQAALKIQCGKVYFLSFWGVQYSLDTFHVKKNHHHKHDKFRNRGLCLARSLNFTLESCIIWAKAWNRQTHDEMTIS